jgi:transcriptional regulator with XRE-family HTH domain
MLTDEHLERFRRYLWIFRNSSGWSSEEFGKMLGITRATVSGIETGSIKMNPLHYYAMRFLFQNYGEQMVNDLIDILADSESTTQEERDRLESQISMIKRRCSNKNGCKAVKSVLSCFHIVNKELKPI